jgi:S-adenosylhomocysteine hydrolase
VEIDRKIAALKLKTMDLPIDRPTAEQVKYMSSWNEGT